MPGRVAVSQQNLELLFRGSAFFDEGLERREVVVAGRFAGGFWSLTTSPDRHLCCLRSDEPKRVKAALVSGIAPPLHHPCALEAALSAEAAQIFGPKCDWSPRRNLCGRLGAGLAEALGAAGALL